jgi:hypothetical protein
LYPKACIEVEVSSDEDAGLKPNAPIDQEKTSAGDDAGDEWISSAEQKAPHLISLILLLLIKFLLMFLPLAGMGASV